MKNIFQSYPIWLIILIAFGLSVVTLDILPASANLDEATNGLDALKLIEMLRITPFLQNNFGRETLYFYLQGLSLYLFGLDGSAQQSISCYYLLI